MFPMAFFTVSWRALSTLEHAVYARFSAAMASWIRRQYRFISWLAVRAPSMEEPDAAGTPGAEGPSAEVPPSTVPPGSIEA
jgi:hypothetical protein